MDDRTETGSLETRLNDGTRVLIRTVEPDDKAGFVEGFERLSPRSRDLRLNSSTDCRKSRPKVAEPRPSLAAVRACSCSTTSPR